MVKYAAPISQNKKQIQKSKCSKRKKVTRNTKSWQKNLWKALSSSLNSSGVIQLFTGEGGGGEGKAGAQKLPWV